MLKKFKLFFIIFALNFSFIKTENKNISIIIPAYNEEDNIDNIYKELTNILGKIKNDFDYSITFVNDGSKDKSWEKIENLAKIDKKIRGIKFTRNFGHQAALIAGYNNANGDAIITMDCDLQDPPTLILEMIDKWQKGAYIVYARRTNRSDTFLKKITADFYYKFLSKVSDVDIPRNVGDFRLIDKQVLNIINSLNEKNLYLRGLVAWTGFKSEFVDFERPERVAGQTGYTWKKMFKLAFDGITSFTFFPLKAFIFLSAFLLIIILFILIFNFRKKSESNFIKKYFIILFFVLAIQNLLFWFLGEYIGRIYEAEKNRPRYIIEKTINI